MVPRSAEVPDRACCDLSGELEHPFSATLEYKHGREKGGRGCEDDRGGPAPEADFTSPLTVGRAWRFDYHRPVTIFRRWRWIQTQTSVAVWTCRRNP